MALFFVHIYVQTAIGVILTLFLGATNSMPAKMAVATLVLVCVYVTGFAWSWGPLAWLIPSEIFPQESRDAGYFFAVSTNMLFTFLIAQAFLTMLCHMRSYIFFFFSAWLAAMFLFAVFFLPETKGVPIDQMTDTVWKKHWFWRRFYDEEEDHEQADNKPAAELELN